MGHILPGSKGTSSGVNGVGYDMVDLKPERVLRRSKNDYGTWFLIKFTSYSFNHMQWIHESIFIQKWDVCIVLYCMRLLIVIVSPGSNKEF